MGFSRWNAIFRFNKRELELNGNSRFMVFIWTRDLGIALLDYGKEEMKRAQQSWRSKEGEQRKKILEEIP